jgi:gp45 sliding clamp, C terminal
MKLSSNTVNILANFANINASLVINPGSTLRTMASTKSVFAKATVPEVFDTSFAIYDLANFLSVVSMFEEPELDFSVSDKYMVIRNTNDKSKFVYYHADPALIKSAPEKDIKVPEYNVSFELSGVVLTKLNKAMSILKTQDVAFVGDGNKITLKALDSKNSTSNAFETVIGETDSTFTAVFNRDNLKVMNMDYVVNLLLPKDSKSPGLGNFTNKDVDYWVALNAQTN